MEITVNSERIDYTLDDEKSLGDVVNGIESWLNQSKLVITSLKLGDRDITAEPEASWSEIPLSEVPALDVTARLLNEVQVSQLQLMHDYLARLADGITRGTEEGLAQLLGAFAELAETMHATLDLTTGTVAAKGVLELSKLITGADTTMIIRWPQGIKDKATDIIKELHSIIVNRLKEIGDPVWTLRNAAEELSQSSFELEEVSVLLQQGEDQKAMAYIVRFSELLTSVLRVVVGQGGTGALTLEDLTVADQKLKDFLNEMNGRLKELVEAFDARDSVLLGDLLEYEISPRVEMLVSFLKELDLETR